MKKVTMFVMEGCPYCRQAFKWMDELMQQYPEYNDVELSVIDETRQPDLAEADLYGRPSRTGTRAVFFWWNWQFYLRNMAYNGIMYEESYAVLYSCS